MTPRRIEAALPYLFCALAVACVAYPIINQDILANVFSKSSYFIMMFLAVLWATSIGLQLSRIQFNFTRFVKDNAIVLGASLILAVVYWISVPGGFKVLSDETNLLSVSQSMFYKKTVYNTTLGKFYYGNFNPVNYPIPTRPLMYPYFTQLMHSIFGYSMKSPFILNHLTVFALFSTLGIVARRFSNNWTAVGSILLAASFPVIALSAQSGGFDLFSTLFFVWSGVALYYYFQAPSSTSFQLLLYTLLMYAHIRYESIGVAGLIGLLVLVMRKLPLDVLRGSLGFVATAPLLVAPILWQRILTKGQYENPPDVPVLSVGKLVEHLGGYFRDQLNFSFGFPYATVLSLTSLGLAAFLVFELVTKKFADLRSYQKSFLVVFLIAFIAMQAIYFSHHFGVYSHPTQARFYIPLSLGSAFIPVLVAIRYPTLLTPKLLCALGFASFFLYHPIAVEGRFPNSLILIRETNFNYEFLQRLNQNDVLVITDRPGQYTALNYGAVDFGYANGAVKELQMELDRRLFSEIIVMQKISYDTKKPVDSNGLSDLFKLEVLEERQLTATEFQRVSRVVRTPN